MFIVKEKTFLFLFLFNSLCFAYPFFSCRKFNSIFKFSITSYFTFYTFFFSNTASCLWTILRVCFDAEKPVDEKIIFIFSSKCYQQFKSNEVLQHIKWDFLTSFLSYSS
jgi:hypothetical protein